MIDTAGVISACIVHCNVTVDRRFERWLLNSISMRRNKMEMIILSDYYTFTTPDTASVIATTATISPASLYNNSSSSPFPLPALSPPLPLFLFLLYST